MWLPLKRVFELRSYHNALRGSTCTFFPWKSIWMVKVPSKMVFFVWTAGLLKILIVNNLHKRHILIVDWCCMCKCSGEFIDHLLLHCSMATDKWSFVFTLSWVMPKAVLNCLNFGNVSFSTTEEPTCGQPCLCASYGICGMKEINGSLMESNSLPNQRACFVVIVWLDVCSSWHPHRVFCWFYWLSFLLSCILWKRACTHLFFMSTFLIKLFLIKKRYIIKEPTCISLIARN